MAYHLPFDASYLVDFRARRAKTSVGYALLTQTFLGRARTLSKYRKHANADETAAPVVIEQLTTLPRTAVQVLSLVKPQVLHNTQEGHLQTYLQSVLFPSKAHRWSCSRCRRYRRRTRSTRSSERRQQDTRWQKGGGALVIQQNELRGTHTWYVIISQVRVQC